MFQETDMVVLCKDLPGHQLKNGDLGSVVHVYESGDLEVEFTTLQGRTHAVVSLNSNHVRALSPDDINHVRQLSPEAA